MPKASSAANGVSLEEAGWAAAHEARIAAGGFRPGDAGTPGAAEFRAAEAVLAKALAQASEATQVAIDPRA